MSTGLWNGRAGHTSAVLGGKVVLFGGSGIKSGGHIHSDTAEVVGGYQSETFKLQTHIQ